VRAPSVKARNTFITALLPTYGNSNGNGDVALLAEMLQTLVAGLLVGLLQDEVAPLGLQINWAETKIQQVGEPRLTKSTVQMARAGLRHLIIYSRCPLGGEV